MPLIVMVLLDHEAVTPPGKVVTVPIPVAPEVVCVMLPPEASLKAVFTHKVRSELVVLTVLDVVTMILPVAFTVPQPPVNGMV